MQGKEASQEKWAVTCLEEYKDTMSQSSVKEGSPKTQTSSILAQSW